MVRSVPSSTSPSCWSPPKNKSISSTPIPAEEEEEVEEEEEEEGLLHPLRTRMGKRLHSRTGTNIK
jgi:hypothetical protein